MRSKSAATRPERTREHYLADISRNFVERLILQGGHTTTEPRSDYGYDLQMTTYDYGGDTRFRSGQVENGQVFLQLKATDAVELLEDGNTIPIRIKRRHAVLWAGEPMPVYLLVYSHAEGAAYWLQVQTYLSSPSFRWPHPFQSEITVHISRESVLDTEAIEAFRRYKETVMSRIRRELDDLYAGL